MNRQGENNIYFFNSSEPLPPGDSKQLLGGKGANLREMVRTGLPVPPGFTIGTGECVAWQKAGGCLSPRLREELPGAVDELRRQAAELRPGLPFLVSVRSGAPLSMPGMMDTVLNLGMNGRVAADMIDDGLDPRFVLDNYRRFLLMYSDVVLGLIAFWRKRRSRPVPVTMRVCRRKHWEGSSTGL